MTSTREGIITYISFGIGLSALIKALDDAEKVFDEIQFNKGVTQ